MIPQALRSHAVVFCTVALLACSIGVRAESVEDVLLRAEVLDVKLEAKEALLCYLEVEKLRPEDPVVLVGIARQYRHLMADVSDEEEKLRLGNEALEYGRRAAAAAPENSDAQLSCAISYGKMLPLVSNREQVCWSKLIKEGAERAIKLNGSNDLAWHILGRWHRNVAATGAITRALAAMIYEKLPEASNEDAIKCLRRAVELGPDRLMHYIELGRAYAQSGDAANARLYLQKGLAMPCVDKDDPTMKAAGREALAELGE